MDPNLGNPSCPFLSLTKSTAVKAVPLSQVESPAARAGRAQGFDVLDRASKGRPADLPDFSSHDRHLPASMLPPYVNRTVTKTAGGSNADSFYKCRRQYY